MPLDPRIWQVPPQWRKFPDDIADAYAAEGADALPLNDVLELWQWKNDLASMAGGPFSSAVVPDERKMANQLGQEVSDFLRIEEESQAAIKAAEQELAQGRLRRIVESHTPQDEIT